MAFYSESSPVLVTLLKVVLRENRRSISRMLALAPPGTTELL